MFSPHFCGKKCPEKSSSKILLILFSEDPRHISAEGPGQKVNSPSYFRSELAQNSVCSLCQNQRSARDKSYLFIFLERFREKTKGQQLKGKIVS